MPVDYINGLHWKLCVGLFRYTATRRIFCCSKTSQSILSKLESSLVELLSQITRKFMSPWRQELLKIPICFIVTKTSAMKPLPATILLHVWRARAAEQKAFQPTHWPYITRWVLMPTFSFGRRPCTANICCRSHRTCGLQTAHLHFWECLSFASHKSLKDNEGFVLENPHVFSMQKKKKKKKIIKNHFVLHQEILKSLKPSDRYIYRLRNRCSHSWACGII